jgi:peptide subunit release factor RF-3
VPILTFVNKLDREGRDPFDLIDEIEQALALDVTPASWPIGMGRDFLGTWDLFADALLLFERGVHDRVTEPVRCDGLDDPKLPRLLPKEALAKLREEAKMAEGLCPPFGPPRPAKLRSLVCTLGNMLRCTTLAFEGCVPTLGSPLLSRGKPICPATPLHS